MEVPSAYNYYIPENDFFIYFNGLTKVAFSLRENEHRRMQELLGDLRRFKHDYPSVFLKFKEWGYLVEKREDELHEILSRNRAEIRDDSTYFLILNPTLQCNLDCWYCYENHASSGAMDLSTIHKIKNHLRYVIDTLPLKKLVVSYFGGEPLLYFKEAIKPLYAFAVEICNENHIELTHTFTTNGTLINRYFIKELKKYDTPVHFQITLDGGREKHNKIRNQKGQPTFDNIVNHIHLLCEHLPAAEIILRINYDHETLNDPHLKEIFSLINPAYRKKIYVDFERIFQTKTNSYASGDYAPLLDHMEYCKALGYPTRTGNDLITDRFHACHLDLFYARIINFDGKIYACTARDFTPERCVGELNEDGTITWADSFAEHTFSSPTFENEHCMSCKHLPLCFGPCSQLVREQQENKTPFICDRILQDLSFETKISLYYHRIYG